MLVGIVAEVVDVVMPCRYAGDDTVDGAGGGEMPLQVEEVSHITGISKWLLRPSDRFCIEPTN